MKWWCYFLLNVVMVRGRKLKKNGGGDLEVDKQNVVRSNQTIVQQNVVRSNQGIT